jgi:ABC-type uncharacterized transport system permease subunit
MERVEGDTKMREKIANFLLKDKIIFPLISVGVAFLIAIIVILFAGLNPFVALGSMLVGALGSKGAILNTLTKMTPLILTGLSVAFAFRAGLFNIGAEGQMTMGGIFSVLFGIFAVGIPMYLAIPIALLIGALAGGVWGGIAGYLKAKTGAHEVVSTIMLNSIAVYIGSYLVTGPLQAPGTGQPKTPEILSAVKLPDIITGSTISLSSGFVIAVLMAVVIYIIIDKTTIGYEIKGVGYNPYASEYAGISISKNIVLAMFVSGALAGMAGAIEAMSIHYRFLGALSSGKGFDGISVALLGQNSPIGVIFSAFLFAMLYAGGNNMQLMGIPKDIVVIIQGIIIFMVASDRLMKGIISFRRRKQ